MLSSLPFVRRVLLTAVPSLVLLAGACSDNDGPDQGAGGASASAGRSGSAGNAGSAGKAGGMGSSGDAGSSGSAASSGDAGSSGSNAEAGAAGAPQTGNVVSPVQLGTAENYAILAKSAISNVPTSAITGNLGLSPAAGTYVTGFSLTNAGTHWTSPQVVGGIFAADNDAPTSSDLTTAVANMLTAYTDAAGRSSPNFLDLGAGTVDGLTLVPGLYSWQSSLTIPGDVTLAGAANDVWIFQISGDLKLSAAKAMTLSGGARAKNIFWQVAGAVDFGTTSHSEGIVLCKTAITLGTGASINGRLLAQTAVNVAGSTVSEPAL